MSVADSPTVTAVRSSRQIPQALIDTPQWILWRNEDGRKKPYQARGIPASVTDISHWSDYATADAAFKAGGYSGLGFVFTKADPFFGVDLDNCRDIPTGRIEAWAQKILDTFGTYAETSPSGTGVKLFGRGTLPSDRGKRKKIDGAAGAIETYDWGRYFTVTGLALDKGAPKVVDCQAALSTWFPKTFAASSSEAAYNTEEFDVDDVSDEMMERHRAHLDALEDAVEGSRGSDKTIRALCEIRRLRLNAEQSWELINYFNDNKCTPPWDQGELERKWEHGAKKMAAARTAEEAFDDDLPPLRLLPAIGEDAELDDVVANRKPWSLEEMRGSEFLAAEFPIKWLVDKVLVASDCHVIGGPTKTLKTSITLDLCVAIATGKPFLGFFDVLQSGPVLFCSGESGKSALQRNLRALCDAYKLTAKEVDNLIISPKVPRGDSTEQFAALSAAVRKYGCVYCVVDPAYLSVGAGLTSDAMRNVNSSGEVLARFNELGYSQGCTMALCHHYTKDASRARKSGSSRPLTHTNLSGAGYAEWCRQWLVLDRAKPYARDGKHELRMHIGGSAGHTGDYELSIDEGFDTSARRAGGKWIVATRDTSVAAFDEAPETSSPSDFKPDPLHGVRQGFIKALTNEYQTLKSIRGTTNGTNAKKVMAVLVSEGVAEKSENAVPAGNQHWDGYKRGPNHPQT